MTINNVLYEKAKEEMLTASGEDCQHFFVKNNCLLELGYWELLHENPTKADKIFKKICDSDIRASWGLFISALARGEVTDYPTYFELRNFLEIDLNIFLTYCLGDYVENIIKYADWLYTINPEVHKFIGRVFLKNGFEEYGLFFLNRAKDYFFTDPELHYLLAEYYAQNNDTEKTKDAIRDCLNILPGYYPALALQEKLKLNCKE